MPFTPPDPGKLRVILDGFLAQLVQLELLATEHEDVALAAEARAVRALITMVEARLAPATPAR